MGEINQAQRYAAFALLSAALSAKGFQKIQEIMEGDEVLKTRENHHEIRIAAYLVNCLMPRDPDIRITAQKRSHQQSLYELSYVQDGMPQGPLPLWSPGTPVLAGTAALLLLVQLVLKWRQRAPTAVSDNGS